MLDKTVRHLDFVYFMSPFIYVARPLSESMQSADLALNLK